MTFHLVIGRAPDARSGMLTARSLTAAIAVVAIIVSALLLSGVTARAGQYPAQGS